MPVVPAGRLVGGPDGSVVDAMVELERLREAVRAHRAATLSGVVPVGGVRRQDRALWGLVPDDEPEPEPEGDDDGEG